MKLQEICTRLQQLSSQQQLTLSQDTFAHLTAVDTLLQRAFGASSLSLSKLRVQPERACLDGTVDQACFLGQHVEALPVHLLFWEEAEAGATDMVLGVLLEVAAPDHFPPPFQSLPGQTVLSPLHYSFKTLETLSFALCSASGSLEANGQRFPVLLTFFTGGGQIRLTLDRTAEPRPLSLTEIGELLGKADYLQLFPDSFQQLLDHLNLEDLVLEYQEEDSRIRYFSLSLSLPGSICWQPCSNLALSLSALQLSLFASPPSRSAPELYAQADGQITLGALSLAVQVGFTSSGQCRLSIGSSPVPLDSLDCIWDLVGIPLDTTCLPVSSTSFCLKNLCLDYQLSPFQLTTFCLDLSVQDVWSFHGLEIRALSFGLSWSEHGTAYYLGGGFALGDVLFSLNGTYETDGWYLNAAADFTQAPSLSSLLSAAMGCEQLPVLPDFALTNVAFSYQPNQDFYTLSGSASVCGKDAVRVCFSLMKREAAACAAIYLDSSFCAAQLPFVGGLSQQLDQVSMERLLFFYTSAPAKAVALPGIAEAVTAPAGLSCLLDLTLPQGGRQLVLPISTQEQHQLAQNQSGGHNFQGMLPLCWHMGPLSVKALTFACRENYLSLGLSAALITNGLSLTLDQMALSCELSTLDLSASLEGLSVDVSSGQLTLSGGLRRSDAQTDCYTGSVQLQMGSFGITLYGACQSKPAPAGFLLGVLRGQLGGPPCFSLTGVAAGFGCGRSLCVPPVQQLEDFALLMALRGKIDPAALLDHADQDFPVKAGANWVAAGITANSFRMVDSTLVATVLLDQGVSINLLGQADIAVPHAAPQPLAELGLSIRLSINPSSGLIPVDGVLTPTSYVLSKDCHLSGGFSMYFWYSGPHAGDFVITLGGYRSGYTKPFHYPAPDRLALNWKLCSELDVAGSLYFALTPSCIMVGGDFQMVFAWKCVRAWFHAYVDLLLGWKPYTYALNIGINMGVRVNLKLFKVQLELGCDLSIWGPDFSGKAHIHLWIISFTISFGHGKTAPSAISPSEFCTSFLPPVEYPTQSADSVSAFGGVHLSVSGGQTGEVPLSGSNETETMVSGSELVLTVQSPVPFVALTWNGSAVSPDSDTDPLYLRPCQKSAAPTLQVVLKRRDGSPLRAEYTLKTVTGAVPSALWAEQNAPSETRTCCTGLVIRPQQDQPCRSLDFSVTCREDQHTVSLSAPPVLPRNDYDQTQAYAILDQLADPAVQARRAQFLADLPEDFRTVSLSGWTSAPEIFDAAPILMSTGGLDLG